MQADQDQTTLTLCFWQSMNVLYNTILSYVHMAASKQRNLHRYILVNSDHFLISMKFDEIFYLIDPIHD